MSKLGDSSDPGARFYENRFPEPEDLVMVRVQRIAEMGAYAALLEYNELEGMILMSELSKRRFRSVNKLIKVGRHEVVMVLRVDTEKGYIDLSKRRVSHEDIAKCEERYSKSKKVAQTVRHVANKHNLTMAELNQTVIWPLTKKYGHALDALKEAAVNPEKVFDGLNVAPHVVEHLVADIKTRLAPSALRVQARMHVACFGYEGVDAVKAALMAGKRAIASQGSSNKDSEMSVRLIAVPQYVVSTVCSDKEEGLARMNETLKIIEQSITASRGGEFKLDGEIQFIGGDDEARIKEINEEEQESDSEDDSSDGDDEEEEEDTGMGLVQGDEPEDEVVAGNVANDGEADD